MAQHAHSPERRANPLEIVGAWLHVWVPPRDAYVPPIPWKKLGIGLAAVLVVAGIVLAILIPRIDDHKTQTAAETKAYKAHALAVNRARITKAQMPRHGAEPSLKPAAGATAVEVTAAQQQLLGRLEDDIYADAQARAKTGEIRPVTTRPTCEHTPGTPTTGDVRVFDCFMITTRIPQGEHNPAGAMGYPFRAVVDFKSFTYNFCKTEQVPGEMLVLAPKDVTLLPAACRGPRS